MSKCPVCYIEVADMDAHFLGAHTMPVPTFGGDLIERNTVAIIASMLLVQDSVDELNATIRHVVGNACTLGWPEACERACDLLDVASTTLARRVSAPERDP